MCLRNKCFQKFIIFIWLFSIFLSGIAIIGFIVTDLNRNKKDGLIVEKCHNKKSTIINIPCNRSPYIINCTFSNNNDKKEGDTITIYYGHYSYDNFCDCSNFYLEKRSKEQETTLFVLILFMVVGGILVFISGFLILYINFKIEN